MFRRRPKSERTPRKPSRVRNHPPDMSGETPRTRPEVRTAPPEPPELLLIMVAMLVLMGVMAMELVVMLVLVRAVFKTSRAPGSDVWTIARAHTQWI